MSGLGNAQATIGKEANQIRARFGKSPAGFFDGGHKIIKLAEFRELQLFRLHPGALDKQGWIVITGSTFNSDFNHIPQNLDGLLNAVEL